MKKIYTAWGLNNETLPHMLVGGEDPVTYANGEKDPECEKIFWQIEASTWEEAMAIHHLRQGFEPYKPMGKAEPCPKCGALFYPQGGGECWSCDYEC
jgi:hypothetical protein